MRADFALALLLAACGDDAPATDEETHRLETCDADWPVVDGATIADTESCEAPCTEPGGVRSTQQDSGCAPTVDSPYGPPNELNRCDMYETSLWHGRLGCCLWDRARQRIAFYTCE